MIIASEIITLPAPCSLLPAKNRVNYEIHNQHPSLYQTKGLELPARKTQVYEQAVDMMLTQWKIKVGADISDRNIKLIEDNKRRSRSRVIKKSLQKIAYHFSCQHQEVFTGNELYDQLEEYLDDEEKADDLLEKLTEDYGIIQKLSEESDQYLFLHRTFQEYLTAAYIQKKNQEDRIKVVKNHLRDFDWHETISLVAGLMSDTDRILLLKAIKQEKDDIFNTLLLLAGLCICECPNIKPHRLITKIVGEICQFWQSYPNASFIESIVVTLGKIGYQEAVEKLIKALNHFQSNHFEGAMYWAVKEKIVEALGNIGNKKALEALREELNDPEESVADKAAVALAKILGKIDSKDEETVKTVKDLIQNPTINIYEDEFFILARKLAIRYSFYPKKVYYTRLAREVHLHIMRMVTNVKIATEMPTIIKQLPHKELRKALKENLGEVIQELLRHKP